MDSKPQQRWQQQVAHPRRNPSTSTGDSDPFPEILSWAALIDVQTTLRYTQSIPSDVEVLSKPEENDTVTTWDDAAILSTIFDPTTLEVGVDHSCLEGLDDLLLHSPTDSFASICWADAVGIPSHLDHSLTSSPGAKVTAKGPWCRGRSPLVPHTSSDDSDTVTDNGRTYNDDRSPLVPIHNDGYSSALSSGLKFPAETKQKAFLFDDCNTSFMMLEPHFPISDPKDSVGFFPIPVSRHKSKPSRIATFCANFPARLVKSSVAV